MKNVTRLPFETIFTRIKSAILSQVVYDDSAHRQAREMCTLLLQKNLVLLVWILL